MNQYLDMTADLCRWYGWTPVYSVFRVSADMFMMMWVRGRIAEKLQALRVGGCFGGGDIDVEIEKQLEEEARKELNYVDWDAIEAIAGKAVENGS